MDRKIFQIARDIRETWKKPSPYALPYLNAMLTLRDPSDTYYMDSAHSVALYFLANAGSWRGEDARRLKAELKALVNIS